MAPPAFLLVFSEPGPNVSEEEFHDWYDNEHIPLRVNTMNWTRWKAIDGEKPAYGASHDLVSYEETKKAPYTTLAETRSGREKDILSRIETLDRRHYELYEGPTTPPSTLYSESHPAPYGVFVSLDLKPEYEEEFNKWYDEEHIPMLARAPGWVRTRRFVLKDHGQLGAGGRSEQIQRPPKYLAVHEWSSLAGFESKEYKEAMATPRRNRIYAGVIGKERRVMSFLRKWDRVSS
ncbi:hypothetical protein WOLCODRAFT_130402 [Wolfiporia cocos MD-104 SS10]|uniref:EthD domain-containing protein n=1 Tax=Wolfiporia cocos (strain MD-104) TaxID=742152 RepID=A0A2H3JIQ8_WOLCO|nr:hypothetical protein WOLCODRAFT_130402 [Wolfiporia cocos MD-104 SS10]